MNESKPYGHARKGAVPLLPETTAKVCPKCDLWFAARGRERSCPPCLSRPSVRSRRAALGSHTGMALNGAETAGYGHPKSPMGRSVCSDLALAAARHADLGSKPWNDCAGWCGDGCRCACHAAAL